MIWKYIGRNASDRLGLGVMLFNGHLKWLGTSKRFALNNDAIIAMSCSLPCNKKWVQLLVQNCAI